MSASSLSWARKNRAEKYLKAAFEFCLKGVAQHFMISVFDGRRVYSAYPFLKAVDPLIYTDYASIVAKPMDFAKMLKNLTSGKYISADAELPDIILSFLADVDLIRDNCYTYNTEKASDINAMADATREYFRYLVRVFLKLVRELGDSALQTVMLGSPPSKLESFLSEPITEVVSKFLTISAQDKKPFNLVEQIIKGEFLNILGVKGAVDSRNAVERAVGLADFSPAGPTLTLSISKGRKSTSQAPIPPPPPPPVEPAVQPKKGGRKAPVAASPPPPPAAPLAAPNSFGDDDRDAIFDAEVEVGGGVLKLSGARKRKRKAAIEFDDFDAVPEMAQEDVDSIFNDPSDLAFSPLAVTHTNAKKKAKKAPPASSNQAYADDVFDEDEQALGAGGADGGYGRALSAWEEGAMEVLRTLGKHPWVDLSKPATVAVNFYIPIPPTLPAHMLPTYLSLCPHPMDLTTLWNLLVDGEVAREAEKKGSKGSYGGEEFAYMLSLVFQNAITFNRAISGVEGEWLVNRCEVLLKYAQWLCEEHIPPCPDALASSSSRGLFDLSVEGIGRSRQERDDKVFSCSLALLGSSGMTELKKMLKDIERCKTSLERKYCGYFSAPVDEKLVADYAVLVRHPMDLSTVKYKLEGVLPSDSRVAGMIDKSAPRYVYVGELLKDVKLVFDNSIRFNKAYVETDNTGLSRILVEVATGFRERVDVAWKKYSVILGEKMLRAEVVRKEEERKAAEKRAKDEEESRERFEIERRIRLELDKSDILLTFDEQRERERLEREENMKKEILEKQLRLVQRAGARSQGGGEEDIVVEGLDPLTGPAGSVVEALGEGTGSSYANTHATSNLSGGLVLGYGVGGSVPAQFSTLVPNKLLVSRRAWELFTPDLASA